MKLEEKIKLFGHFMFCNVKCGDTTISMQSIDGNSGCINGPANAIQLPIEDCKLVLKPLNKVSLKHARVCAEIAELPEAFYKNWAIQTNIYNKAIFSFPEVDNYRNMIVFDESKLSFRQIDFLRSCGYLVDVPEGCYVIEK